MRRHPLHRQANEQVGGIPEEERYPQVLLAVEGRQAGVPPGVRRQLAGHRLVRFAENEWRKLSTFGSEKNVTSTAQEGVSKKCAEITEKTSSHHTWPVFHPPENSRRKEPYSREPDYNQLGTNFFTGGKSFEMYLKGGSQCIPIDYTRAH